MSDKDFDFRRPSGARREAKRFEPPPWEREAFEELEKRRARPEPESGAEAAAEVAETPEVAERPATSQTAAEERATSDTAGERAVPVEPTPAGEAPAQGTPAQVEDRVVIELMAGLAAQEPSLQPVVQRVSLFSALIISALGTVMILWGMAALIGSRISGPIGAFGGAVLLFFGAVAIAGAVWLTVRTLRQRGVL